MFNRHRFGFWCFLFFWLSFFVEESLSQIAFLYSWSLFFLSVMFFRTLVLFIPLSLSAALGFSREKIEWEETWAGMQGLSGHEGQAFCCIGSLCSAIVVLCRALWWESTEDLFFFFSTHTHRDIKRELIEINWLKKNFLCFFKNKYSKSFFNSKFNNVKSFYSLIFYKNKKIKFLGLYT